MLKEKKTEKLMSCTRLALHRLRYISNQTQEMPQLAMTTATMCLTNFPAGKHNANQLRCICNYMTAWRAQCGKELGLSWRVEGSRVANGRKLTHDFTSAINTKFCSISHRLTTVRWASSGDCKFWGLGERFNVNTIGLQ